MEGGGHTDDGGGLPHQRPHGVLSLIDVAVHLRQGAVIPDRAHQHKGHLLADALIHDAVSDLTGLHEGLDGAQAANLIDGVDVVIVPIEVGLLCIHVLPQSGSQIARLQVVGGQSVSGHQPVDKPGPNQGGEGGPGIGVEGAGRPHDPKDIAVLPLVTEQVI